MPDPTSSDFLTFAATLTAFMALLLTALSLYRTRRAARYDMEKQRAQLDALRESYERRMYDLTAQMMQTQDRWANLNHLLVSQARRQEHWGAEEEVVPTPFLRSLGIADEAIAVDPRLIFVLTPFHPSFQEDFEVIQHTCAELGFLCVRGDEEHVPGELMPHIMRLIVRARLIIANIGGRNPNVFYELGVAHAMGKPTIMVSKAWQKVPFDFRTRKLLLYTSQAELREGLRSELTRTLAAR